MARVEQFDVGEFNFDDIHLKHELTSKLEERLLRSDTLGDDSLRSFQAESDPDQLAVIRDKSRAIRILAPAGAGKTQTIVNRLIQQVKEGSRPDRLLMLTFDNAAATAIKNKLAEALHDTGLSPASFRATTLNAFGYGILRDCFPEDYRPVVSSGEALNLIRLSKKTLREQSRDRFIVLPSNIKNRFYLDFFGLLKNSLFDPRALDAQALADYLLSAPQASIFFQPGQTDAARKLILQALIWLFKKHEQALARAGRLDFDDQKLRPWASLVANASMLEVISSRFDEVIVDEFQDINRLDFELIRLVARTARLVVTGDDDQAIYGFRGCSPDYIIDFGKHLDSAISTHELRINYRCPANIVDYATRLIRNNKRRIEKNPIANRKDNAAIKVVSAGSAYIEARAIVAFIKKIRASNKTLDFSDVAVLYRTNAQSLPIQVEFILNDVPFYVRDADNILSNNLLERLLSILRVKVALAAGGVPTSADAVESVKAYFRYLPTVAANRLERIFQRGVPFLETVRSDEFRQAYRDIGQSAFHQHIAEVMRIPKLTDCLTYIGQNFPGMRGMIGSLEEVIEGGVPLGEIFELAAAFRGSITEFIDKLSSALRRAREMGAGKDQTHGVSLLTYFRAKGLQWHTVVLTTCNSGLIPHKNAPVEDERRLFYVALTRASSNLFVSYLKKACGTKVAVSPFLVEAGLVQG